MGCLIYTLPDGTEVHAHISDEVEDMLPETLMAINAVAQAAADYLDDLLDDE